MSLTGVGTSAAAPPISSNLPQGPFATSLPIRIGDHIGLDSCAGQTVIADTPRAISTGTRPRRRRPDEARHQLSYTGTGLSVSCPATVRAPGEVRLTVRTTGKKRRKLNRRGKVAVSLTATFTPNGGTAGTSNDSLSFRKKL